ncbi:uncharacterized protein LOC116239500 [Phasianus colchicus]|uniref:uncharacterized protein LOC116239500 n=1 Tax=Phasianus colchicus TaxID=9054 RepID=UPI00129E03D7|nr:uncharacterized protein LOC116239500 [Phasianus colchicus]
MNITIARGGQRRWLGPIGGVSGGGSSLSSSSSASAAGRLCALRENFQPSPRPVPRPHAGRGEPRWDAAVCSEAPRPSPAGLRAGGLQAGGRLLPPPRGTRPPWRGGKLRARGAEPIPRAALRSACCRCAGGVRALRAFATLPGPLRLHTDVFVCALPPRSERQSGGRGSVRSFCAQNAEPSFRRRSEPQPNKSYFQEVECFILFRLIFNVALLSVCNTALDLQRRSAGLAPCFWLVGNGFEDLVTISVHVLSLLSCFRTRFDCIFNGDE